MIPLHAQLAFFVDLAVCGLALVRYRHLSKDLRILTVYFFVSAMSSVLQYYLATRHINNLWFIHLFTPIQYAFFAWIFSTRQKEKRRRLALQASTIVFALLCLGGVLFFEDLRSFNSYTKPVEGLLLVFLSGRLLYEIDKESLDSLARQPQFWFSAATLVYFSGLLVLHALSSLLLSRSVETLRTAWVAHSVVSIISSSLYGVAFLCPSTRQISGGHS